MSRSTLLKRSIIRVYSIVTFTASVITSRRQRHGKCRPENLPFYKLSRALTTNINPLYSSGMIPGACTIRRTNKSDSGVAVSLSLSVSFREPSKEYFSHILAHTLTIHCPSLSLSLFLSFYFSPEFHFLRVLNFNETKVRRVSKCYTAPTGYTSKSTRARFIFCSSGNIRGFISLVDFHFFLVSSELESSRLNISTMEIIS